MAECVVCPRLVERVFSASVVAEYRVVITVSDIQLNVVSSRFWVVTSFRGVVVGDTMV